MRSVTVDSCSRVSFVSSTSLFSSEGGCPFFEEMGHSLAKIFRAEACPHLLNRHVYRLFEILRLCRVNLFLDDAQRTGRYGGRHLCRIALHGGKEIFVRQKPA